MFQGSAPGSLLDGADLVIVIESDVPWMPSTEAPPAGARIAQIGEDPLYARYPMRSFPSDLTITARALSALEAIASRREESSSTSLVSGLRPGVRRSMPV
jgi:acetolactate synthase-1/2/3 large subunit